MEGGDRAGTRVRVAFVAEVCLGARGFVEEREGENAGGQETGEVVRQVCGVVAGLVGHGGKRGAGFFGLDHADGFAVGEQEVIAATGLQRDLAHRDPSAGAEVELFIVLHLPVAAREESVDLLAGKLFG